ncbi:MAG: hypothetical protein ACOYT9_02305 [Patescibacteria group bacterium]
MLFRFLAQIVYTILVIIETLLSLRFILKLINIGNQVGIIAWLYITTDKILRPFLGIVTDSVVFWGFTIELTTLLVLFILSVISYAVYEIIKAYS